MNTNEWVDLKGYEGLYKINREGKVLKLKRTYTKKDGVEVTQPQKELKLSTNGKEYPGYVLSDSNWKRHWVHIHRLLAIQFIPNPNNKAQVNHKNTNKFDFNLDNLEWVTKSENSKHAWENGLYEEARKIMALSAKKRWDKVKINKL